jgi:hypothetical protein
LHNSYYIFCLIKATIADSICIDDDEWWFNEIIGKGNKDHLLPVRKRILSTNSLIECLIESGSLDFIWEEEKMDENNPRRYGRTKKLIIMRRRVGDY